MDAISTMNVGVIGCGNILSQYVRGCRQFEVLHLTACADLIPEKAEAAAAEHGIPRVLSVPDLLADPDIDLVINLTIPAAHAEVSMAAIAAGKHVHSEKPLAITLDDGRAILEAAARQDVRVGCAPDTFLGGGLQTARKLLDDGLIGRPVAAAAFMMGHGPEHWHPNPDFFYQVGAGPVFDMGPYYLTALVHLLGPVARVTGVSTKGFPERVITNPHNRTGETIPVQVNTHTAGVLDFASGAVGTMIFSWDVWGHNLPRIEIYGTKGSMTVPDPNRFDGTVRVQIGRDGDWNDVPLQFAGDVSRGIGAADMVHAIHAGRPHRASGALAYHVLDIMHAFDVASESGAFVTLDSGVPRPAPLPVGLAAGLLDD